MALDQKKKKRIDNVLAMEHSGDGWLMALPEPDWDEIHAAIAAGYEANDQLANYYDSLSTEEVEAMWEDAEEVEVHTPPEGTRVAFMASFSHDEALVLSWAAEQKEKTVMAFIHDAAVSLATMIKVADQLAPTLRRLSDLERQDEMDEVIDDASDL